MFSRTTLLGSSQSRLTLRMCGFLRIDIGDLARDLAHVGISGPVTRNCTGYPTGGPFSRRTYAGAQFAEKSTSNRPIRSLRNFSRSAGRL
jgi:hypothetical protein